MDFSFTDEQEVFRKSVRAFCEKHVVPRINEIDEKGEIPHEIVEDMGTLALLGMATMGGRRTVGLDSPETLYREGAAQIMV
jgi:alkylation response protein AidB-like acyl-CoA dehydrogenase